MSKSITEMALWMCGLEDARLLINDTNEPVWILAHNGSPAEHGKIMKNGAVTRWDEGEQKFLICSRITHRVEAFNDYVQSYKNKHASLRARVLAGENHPH